MHRREVPWRIKTVKMNPLGWKRLWSLWLPLLSTPTLLALCLWAGGAHFGLAYPWTAAGRDLAWQTVLAWGTAFFQGGRFLS